jgi:DNA mismatch endonuclease (patch repair protein)
VFVDGCFWHGCARCQKQPSRNSAYWTAKIARNQERDRAQVLELEANGWTVIRLWGHEIEQNVGDCVARVASAIAAQEKEASHGADHFV